MNGDGTKIHSVGEFSEKIWNRLGFGALEPLIRICDNWRDIVGDVTLAEYSEPVSLEDDILVVRMKNASCRFFLKSRSDEIKAKILEVYPDIRIEGIRLK